MHSFITVMCINEDESSLSTVAAGREKFGPHFVQLSLCFLSWAQTSEEVCNKYIELGFLVDYIRIFKGSRLSRDTKVHIIVVFTHLYFVSACISSLPSTARREYKVLVTE